MARYSRRRGPPASFELTAILTTIPGLSFTRFFDDGELLIAAYGVCQNGTIVTIGYRLTLFIDAVNITPDTPVVQIPAGLLASLSFTLLTPISRGQHTIDLRALGAAAVGDIIVANTASLSIIQLPLWDRDTDLL